MEKCPDGDLGGTKNPGSVMAILLASLGLRLSCKCERNRDDLFKTISRILYDASKTNWAF